MTLAVGLAAHRYHYRTLLLARGRTDGRRPAPDSRTVTDLWPLVVDRRRRHAQSVERRRQRLPADGAGGARARRRRSPSHRGVRALRARRHACRRAGLARGRRAGADRRARPAGRQRASLQRHVRRCTRCSASSAAFLYRGLPRSLASSATGRRRRSARSRRAVVTLAALFSLDAFGGGFVVQSLVALWLYQRFGLSLATAGTLFFATGVLSALSYLVAVAHREAHRARQHDGLHAPARQPLPRRDRRSRRRQPVVIALLCAAQPALADGRADAQLLRDGHRDARGAPGGGERHGRAAQPRVRREPVRSQATCSRCRPSAGRSSLAGALKIVYDLLLLANFRHIRPPEEIGR